MSKNDPRKALGKGLHSLLPTDRPGQRLRRQPPSVRNPLTNRSRTFPSTRSNPNPNQPRREFDEAALLELTQSIERDGIIQPIIVRKTAPDQYQIIAGERRWRAAKLRA